MTTVGSRAMETLAQAIERLESAGFTAAFRALGGGRLAAESVSYAPDDLVVEEVVRFEGESDPEDSAVLFALSADAGRVRGTFVASYGPQMDSKVVAAIEGLQAPPEKRSRHRGVAHDG